MRLEHYIINEAAYDANLGFEELCKFYQIASQKELKKLEEILKNEDWESFKRLIKKCLKISLK